MNIEPDEALTLETDNDDPRAQIARLEARLEDLADAMARCRKIKLLSQIAITVGGIWLLAVTIGIVELNPVSLIAAISAVIGGIVLYGSNTTTSREVDAAIKGAEALRAELIGTLDLRVVGERK